MWLQVDLTLSILTRLPAMIKQLPLQQIPTLSLLLFPEQLVPPMVKIGKEDNLYQYVSLPQIQILVKVNGANNIRFVMDIKLLTMFPLIEDHIWEL